MKALRTLLRIARRDMETLRRALADEIAKQSLAEESLLALAHSVAGEQQRARENYEATRAYGGFAVHATARRRAIESEITAIAAECDRLRTLIAEAHVETRKFERLIELQEAREKAVREKREAAELDEMATQRAGRNRT